MLVVLYHMQQISTELAFLTSEKLSEATIRQQLELGRVAKSAEVYDLVTWSGANAIVTYLLGVVVAIQQTDPEVR